MINLDHPSYPEFDFAYAEFVNDRAYKLDGGNAFPPTAWHYFWEWSYFLDLGENWCNSTYVKARLYLIHMKYNYKLANVRRPLKTW